MSHVSENVCARDSPGISNLEKKIQTEANDIELILAVQQINECIHVFFLHIFIGL